MNKRARWRLEETDRKSAIYQLKRKIVLLFDTGSVICVI